MSAMSRKRKQEQGTRGSVTGPLRETAENTQRIQAAMDRAAAGTSLPEDALVTGFRAIPTTTRK
jgi:hypothetical protein